MKMDFGGEKETVIYNILIGRSKNMKTIKLWIDDERQPPASDWVWVREYNSAIMLLAVGSVATISLDHDLGHWDFPVWLSDNKNGYDIVKWIEQQVFETNFIPPTIYCHSQNPVGRKNIEACIESIKKLQKQSD